MNSGLSPKTLIQLLKYAKDTFLGKSTKFYVSQHDFTLIITGDLGFMKKSNHILNWVEYYYYYFCINSIHFKKIHNLFAFAFYCISLHYPIFSLNVTCYTEIKNVFLELLECYFHRTVFKQKILVSQIIFMRSIICLYVNKDNFM